MKRLFLSIISAGVGLMLSPAGMQAQSKAPDKVPSMEEYAVKEADRLAHLLKLEDWQVFYVDSTLQHDYTSMQNELAELKKARVENTDLYQNVQDKWMEQIDRTYQRIFTESQWAAYLKSGAARNQKARDKRKAKRAQEQKN